MSVLKRGAGRVPLLRLPPSLLLLLLAALSLPRRAQAVFIQFQNCLPEAITNSPVKQLQFTPYFVDAVFDAKDPDHTLDLTIWGNVSGQQFTGDYPPPDSPQWSNPNDTLGKIAYTGNNNSYATLVSLYQVLTYTAFRNASIFCDSLVDGSCPLGPSFDATPYSLHNLSAFAVSHRFGSTYAFSAITPTIKVISGDDGAKDIGCISATITPDLGYSITNLLTWLPAAILIIKALATISAAIWSPWGSWDVFRWSSNYGRDEDLLRLVTPGFGDCLQYIQFVVLTGSLSLQYPGFYQPAVSQASWSLLLFNESFVSHGNGTRSLVDGIYNTNATRGLTRMSQLVGMSRDYDVWACMAIWLLVIAGAVVVLCQLGFLGQVLYRSATHTSEEDLRRKNLPFTLGHMNRLLFNFFILPIVSISLFQLVIAPHSPTSVIVCAVILLAIMILSAAWILRVIFATKPRTILFDDMPTVLLYGPLYNTYSDSAAPFALIPVFITFIRGVAIGAVQPSGIAQVIILAVCEVILILTLNGFRPFQGQTSMNLYHTAFASVRLVTILLMVAFVPSLGVTQGPKGWIGYVILLLHACVLVFGFFLNAAQTLVEVVARALGAGDAHSGAIRGSMLTWRMLKKRQTRPDTDRHSMMSSAAILNHPDHPGGRSRSMSASSNQLLNRHSGFENFSNPGDPLGSPDPDIDFSSSGIHGYTGKPSIGSRTDTGEFYRPPRPRKGTFDGLSNPGARVRRGLHGAGKSTASAAGPISPPASRTDFPYTDSPNTHHRHSSSSPAPAFLRDRHGSNDSVPVSPPTREGLLGSPVPAASPRTDYAVREVDQYYRGTALNDQPFARKLKTGPADPESAAVTAQTWLQRLRFGLQGKKTKDASKGFEVVRSARAPVQMIDGGDGGAEGGRMGAGDGTVVEMEEMRERDGMGMERYKDEEGDEQGSKEVGALGSPVLIEGEDEVDGFVQVPRGSHGFDFGLDGQTGGGAHEEDGPPKLRPDSETVVRDGTVLGGAAMRESTLSAFSDEAPSLGPLEVGDEFRFPSRFNSRASAANLPTHLQNNAPIASTRDAGSGAATHDDLSSSPDGQSWLRAVDNLHAFRESAVTDDDDDDDQQQRPRRPHGQDPLSTLAAAANTNNTLEAPGIPRKSSRRGSSQNHSPARHPSEVPIARPTPLPSTSNPNTHPSIPPETQTQDIFDNFDSSPGSPSDLLVRVTSEEGERGNDDRDPGAYASLPAAMVPTPTTNVHRHRAADSITRNSFGANAALRGTSAEVFGAAEEGRE